MVDQERVISLVRTIAADPALRVRLSEADESQRGSILSELGYGDVTPSDVANSAQMFVPHAVTAVEEIDESQLESVAGGGGDTVTTTTTTTTVTAAASAAVAT